ncbi:MAG: SufE family protein [Bacteroidota bacterium]
MTEAIKQRQEEIIDEFELLEGNLEMALDYLIELGDGLEHLEDIYRVDENIVKGCQSKVWMTADYTNNKVRFKADANTAITKGLVSLLVRVLNNADPDDIVKSEIYFPKQIGMDRFIGTQRSNGFASMIKHMKMQAVQFSAKRESSV